MDYKGIITIEPGKRGGKPCIRGMRITVYDILDYLASGMNYQEILADFPYLTQEDIFACLKYAAEKGIFQFPQFQRVPSVPFFAKKRLYD
jgi:uncharacterized protein (DUF433 family)